ncbi:exonuclease II Exo2 [Tilletia horrida]|uniref:5'-3' exoribonuclease 1 n=1 Tax=Tilletia horrida TaxID=155126 RepID=A0AAN6GRR0_9BASI|nr:exonuclease II Exo2 [Tilletia horrida]KAK0564919.1 exonuclease II Exo2 [Tilletia horrida]
MGIPKFFRYTSERYPLISQLIEENKIPEFDALYLDMNGIIHNCSHPDDSNASFRISEEDIFLAIFAYIEHVFGKIKPKKLFYLAVDGVAPRAKMNQQRSRRFRTAKEAKDTRDAALRKGEILPDDPPFDSNCITPGTPFMTRLSQALAYFIGKKVTEDAAWREVEVILSGHEVPGEGEHKIIEHIRLSKAQPGYNPNTRHCMYGLDADLIMLGLLSHDPHFCLLREEVQFGPSRKAKKSLDKQNFYLLHLSLFREYLDLEFQDLKSVLPFPYDLEHIIDDFILLNIFVGNDFLPHLPGLHINKGALNLLFRIYKKVLPVAGGYLNESGTLRVDRLQLILTELALWEKEEFEKEQADSSWIRGKQTKHVRASERAHAEKVQSTMTSAQHEIFKKVRDFVLARRPQKGSAFSAATAPRQMFLSADKPARDRSFLQRLTGDLRLKLSFDEYDPVADAPAIAISVPSLGADDDDEDAEAEEIELGADPESIKAIDRVLAKYSKMTVEADTRSKKGSNGAQQPSSSDSGDDEEEDFYERKLRLAMEHEKTQYYKEKMELDFKSSEDIDTLAFRYIEGLQWVLKYYYSGVASWGWFYNYHYAPQITDLKDVAEMRFNFDLGTPFRPFDQLMGVLPAASSAHIPEPFRDLMTNPESPIKHFYPDNFEADLNGKSADWEAVVKIPFIDEKKLLEALDKRAVLLTAEEKARNTHGVSSRFTYDEKETHLLASPVPGVFPDITHSRAKIAVHQLPKLTDDIKLIEGLLAGVQLGVEALAGFPSLMTLPHFAHLGFHAVNVFQSDSRAESIVLTLKSGHDGKKSEEIAAKYVGQKVYHSWPFLAEGRCVAMTDGLFKYELGSVGAHQQIIKNPMSSTDISAWARKKDRIEHTYSKRFAVITGPIDVLLHVQPLRGLKRTEDGAFLKDFEDNPDQQIDLALQLTVGSILSEDPRYAEQPAVDLQDDFPQGTDVFFLGDKLYGSPAKVASVSQDRVDIHVYHFEQQVRENAAISRMVSGGITERYLPSYAVSKRVGLSALALSKITSSLKMSHGNSSANVGLNLKFESKGEKVLGYSRKSATGWEFSDKAIALIQEYNENFPEIGQRIAQRPRDDLSTAAVFFGEDDAAERFRELKHWIKEAGVRDLEAVPLFAETLSKQTIGVLEPFTERLALAKASPDGRAKLRKMLIKGLPRTALLKPAHAPFRLQGQRFALGDRVMVVHDSGNVPLAALGVIVGVKPGNLDVLFDLPYMSGTTLEGRCSPRRGGSVPPSSLLNLTQPHLVVKNGETSSAAALAPPTQPASSGRGGPGGARGGYTNGHVNSNYQPYHPPNAFRPARGGAVPTGPSGRGRGGAGFGRGGGQHHGNNAAVSSNVSFGSVASGQVQPTQEQARAAAARQASMNPHLSILSSNVPAGPAAGGRGGFGRGGRGGAFGARGGVHGVPRGPAADHNGFSGGFQGSNGHAPARGSGGFRGAGRGGRGRGGGPHASG